MALTEKSIRRILKKYGLPVKDVQRWTRPPGQRAQWTADVIIRAFRYWYGMKRTPISLMLAFTTDLELDAEVQRAKREDAICRLEEA